MKRPRADAAGVLPGARVDNDAFFPAPEPRAPHPMAVPEALFYGTTERPPPEPPFLLVLARTPERLGLTLLLVGWAGILFQASLFQQIVVGAPLFEELAKAGPAVVLSGLLRSRWLRVPIAWASGAGFGWFEHVLTYPDEDPAGFATRVVFHAASAGLTLLAFGALEHLPDRRAWWFATLPSTLLHWANNFGAVALGVASVLVAPAEAVAAGWSLLVTSCVVLLSLVAFAAPERTRRLAERVLSRATPRLVRPVAG